MLKSYLNDDSSSSSQNQSDSFMNQTDTTINLILRISLNSSLNIEYKKYGLVLWCICPMRTNCSCSTVSSEEKHQM